MNWRFTILDRNNVSTEIEEPVGFDALTCEITRDADWHGIFFTNSGETFEFYGVAKNLLKDEYEQYASEGNMTLIMEEECGGVWTEFDRGRFIFSKFEDDPDDCYVKCPLEAVGEIMDLRNNVDQKVDLESLKAFDETTDLVPYNKLAFDLQLPSKGIFMQDKAEWQQQQTTTVNLQQVLWEGPVHVNALKSGYIWFQIVPQFDNIIYNEFGTFATPNAPEFHAIRSQWYSEGDQPFETVINGTWATAPDTRKIFFDWATPTPILFNDAYTNNFDSVKQFSLDISYSFDVTIHPKVISQWTSNIIALYNVLVIRRKNGSYEYLAKERIMCGQAGNFDAYDPTTIWKNGETHNVSFSGSYENLSLADGEYLFAVVCGLATSTEGMIGSDYDVFDLVSNSGSVNLQTLSHFDTTIAKVFAVNEVISRIAESVTNDKLRAYSEYFGRTDSQPYALSEDGCGALEVITNGIRVRGQENKTPGKIDVFSQSLQDVFKGLCPIHNIGMGIEPDTNRAGYNRLRVEPWTFFYNDTLVLSCVGIDKVVRKANDKEIFSIFQFGYDKWEAEEFNGLDELLTKRNYRTTLTQVKNTLAQISTFIASGYALEVTRRKAGSSQDWRYDNDVFIVCVKRGATANFLIQFIAGNTMNVAVYNNDYTLAEQFFTVGATITIAAGLNAGTFTVTAASQITGNLAVTVAETVVNELNSVSVTNNDQLAVELGNVTDPVNIVDPDTLYNFRISPVRNAIRWMKKILASYRQFNTGSKIIFTDGDGNYFAEGEMTDTNCRLENGSLIENQTIDSSDYADAADAHPVLFPERVTYTFPFKAADYVAIKANPRGKIYFESNGDSGYGWIDTIQWNPKDGTANFSLIPKYTN